MSAILNIGVLLGSLNGAGAEKTLLTLASQFNADGHHVTLFTLSDHSDYILPNGITQVVIGDGSRRKQCKTLHNASAQLDLDLYITSKPNYYAAAVAKSRICSVHITPSAWLAPPDKKPFKRMSQLFRLRNKYRGKKLVALSEGIRDDLIKQIRCKPDNVTVIPNPYQIDEIRKKGDEEGRLPDARYIIYVAALIPRKRHADLLRAFSQLSQKDIKLVLAGKGKSEAGLKNLAHQLGIADRVIFWGWDPNPYRLIRHASLSVLASEAEGLPRVVVESLILGVPVVSTNCPSGPAEVLTGALTEWLVPVGDTDSMSKAMDKALKSYPDLKDFDSSRFEARAVAQKYIDFHNAENIQADRPCS